MAISNSPQADRQARKVECQPMQLRIAATLVTKKYEKNSCHLIGIWNIFLQAKP